MKRCKVDGCDRAHMAHGFCGMHYMRMYRNGMLSRVRNPNDERDFYAFAEPVPEAGCWIWTGKVNRFGYGEIRMSTLGFGDIRGAHRISYMMHKGPIPDGLCVCHKCDTPACVNPNHLFLGTHKDNMEDAVSKGRVPKHPTWNAKLSEEEVRQIRKDKRPAAVVAAVYGVNRATIGHIRNRLTWKHI